MDASHLRVLELATKHADYVIAKVAELGRVKPEHLSPLRDLVFDHFLRTYASLDPDRTPTVDLHTTTPPPRGYSETIKGMPTPLPEGIAPKRKR